jgi:hypothetical protein
MGILPPDVRPVVPHMTPSRGWATWGVHVVLLAAAFALADALSALTSGPGSGVAGIWIPGGIGLAGLLLGGLGLWPALVVGGLAAAPAYGALGAATVPIVLANTVAVLVAAWAIGRARTDLRLGLARDILRHGELVASDPAAATLLQEGLVDRWMALGQMARLRALTPEQKSRLADIDRVYQGRLAEREIFLKQQLNDALAASNFEETRKIQEQMASEKARLDEDREAEKNKVRREAEEA